MPPSRRRNHGHDGRTTPDRSPVTSPCRCSSDRGHRGAIGRFPAGVRSADGRNRCGQLPARGVDVGPPGGADGGVDPERPQLVTKAPYALRRGAHHRVAGRRVERDQVDVRPERAGEGRQLGRVAAPVVDTVDQGPLDGEPAAARFHVGGAGVGEHVERVPPVDGDQLVAQGVVRGVERDGQIDRQGLGSQPADPGHHADRREGEVARREAHVAVEPDDGAPDAVGNWPGAPPSP